MHCVTHKAYKYICEKVHAIYTCDWIGLIIEVAWVEPLVCHPHCHFNIHLLICLSERWFFALLACLSSSTLLFYDVPNIW